MLESRFGIRAVTDTKAEGGDSHKHPRGWKLTRRAARRCEMQRNYLPLRIISRAPMLARKAETQKTSTV